LNIEDIKAGKPEDHTDAKDPIFPQNGSPVREPKGKKEPTIPDLFEDYVKSRGLRTRSGGKGVEYLYELVNEAFGVEKPADLDPSKVTPSQFQKWLVTDAESNLRAENYLPLERK